MSFYVGEFCVRLFSVDGKARLHFTVTTISGVLLCFVLIIFAKLVKLVCRFYF
jgi:hypothetical protein